MTIERISPGQMHLTFGGVLADGTMLDVVATVVHGDGGRAVTAVSLDSICRHDDGRRVVGTPRLREELFRRVTWCAENELAAAATAATAPAASGLTNYGSDDPERTGPRC
jgi:hypothetical protein